MKVLQLFEELTKSIKVTTNYYQNTYKYVKIFLLTPEHYKEDLEKSYEESSQAVGRYVADVDTERVYVFSSDALHDDVIEELGLSHNFDKVIRGYYYRNKRGDFITDETRIKKLPWITKYFQYKGHSGTGDYQ